MRTLLKLGKFAQAAREIGRYGLDIRQSLDWNLQGKRKRGQPTNNWLRTLQVELKDNNITWTEAKRAAQDRSQWNFVVQALFSARREDD